MVYGSVLGMSRGMIAMICPGVRPCWLASATMPARSRMPVIPTRLSRKTLTSSRKIIRCRMLPNIGSGSFLLRLQPVPQLLDRVGDQRHQLLLEARLADFAPHLDAQ